MSKKPRDEFWSDADHDLAVAMWARGAKGSAIEAALDHTRTRSAIMGRLNRSTDPAAQAAKAAHMAAAAARGGDRAAPEGDRAEAPPRPTHAPRQARPAPAPAPPILASRIQWVTLVNLKPNQCKWPIGTPGAESFRFCGRALIHHGAPYCAHHASKAYTSLGLRNFGRKSPQPSHERTSSHGYNRD